MPATGGSHDVLVLGGGTAGCVLAARLSEDPACSVCLVEAGPDYGRFEGGRWPAEMIDPRNPSDTHDWEPGGELSLARARVIGGCSAHNAALVAWGHPSDYDGWDAPGWSFEALEPYLRRAESAIGARPIDDSELGPWARAVVDGAEASGIPVLDDFNDPSDGVGLVPLNVQRSARWSTAFAYLDPARERKNLTVLDQVLVDHVVVDGASATGAVVIRKGRRIELAAKVVIVSAGAFGSPSILMRSGIGPGDHLREVGVELTAELPGVGGNLQDHFGVVTVFRPTDQLVRELAVQDAGGRMIASGSIVKARSSGCPQGTWDLHLVSWSALDAQGITGKAWRAQLSAYSMRPLSKGGVRLCDVNPESHPEVELGYISDPEGRDLSILIDGVGLARRIAASEPISRLIEGEAVPGPDAPDIESFIRGNVRGYFHPVGTCAIGSTPEAGAVVDGACRVHGLEDLYVCDASVIPTIPRANTNLTTIAIAERIAGELKG
jgi:choline dehydrogenase